MSQVSDQADIEDGASIGEGTVVWDLTRIRTGAQVGRECVIGRGAFVDSGVVVGDRCKVQNDALLYAPARLANGVFIGPAVVLTNDRFPRAINADGSPKTASNWTPAGVTIGEGASIGASSTIISGVRVGAWALVAAGSVVTRNVAAFALVAGTPARQIGWVGPEGYPLEVDSDGWRCPASNARFVERGGTLEPA